MSLVLNLSQRVLNRRYWFETN